MIQMERVPIEQLRATLHTEEITPFELLKETIYICGVIELPTLEKITDRGIVSRIVVGRDQGQQLLLLTRDLESTDLTEPGTSDGTYSRLRATDLRGERYFPARCGIF
jgi:hypothetical protein